MKNKITESKNTMKKTNSTQVRFAKKLPVAQTVKLWDVGTAESMKASIGRMCDALCLGYSERNWREADYFRHGVSLMSDVELNRKMGETMREAYTHLSYASVEQAKQNMHAYIDARTNRPA